MGGERLKQGSGARGRRSGAFPRARGGGPGAGRLPGIMAEDARRIAQEPAPKLLPLFAEGGRRTLGVGTGHDTGAGYAYSSLKRKLPAGPRPLPEVAESGRERTRAGRGSPEVPRGGWCFGSAH